MRIDLDAILRGRLGRRARWLPRWATRLLERIIHQDELNAMLDHGAGFTGSEFSRRIYDHLDLTLEVVGEENIPAEGRFVFASNHPLGGLDGMGIISFLGARYGDEGFRFVVNDMLMAVEPLRTVFLPVNKYGAQARASMRAVQEAYESDRQIAIFPAGLVSRMQSGAHIADLQWQKSFVQKAVETGRDIIPLRFEGLNRPRFYRLARWRKRLGIKINLEQALLPAELCAARGRRYRLRILPPIPHAALTARLASAHTYSDIAGEVRRRCQGLTGASHQ